jgi:hypothetical protein
VLSAVRPLTARSTHFNMSPSTATLSSRVHLAAAPVRRVARTQRPVARAHRGVRVSALSVGDKVRCSRVPPTRCCPSHDTHPMAARLVGGGAG